MEKYFPTKYFSQIHTVKTNSGLGKLQALATETLQVVEMGTSCHLPLSWSRDLCRSPVVTCVDPWTVMQQALGDADCAHPALPAALPLLLPFISSERVIEF